MSKTSKKNFRVINQYVLLVLGMQLSNLLTGRFYCRLSLSLYVGFDSSALERKCAKTQIFDT